MNILSKTVGSILGSFGNSVVSEIKVEDLSVKDVIVAVMGPTGSGKSSFIEIATGVEGRVGHSLESCTSEISVVKLSFPELVDSDICFVDTPGFDDTNKSDVDIFKMISEWLNDTYKRKIQLTGLLYFHRISDNRMAGTPLKNLRLFERLCGDDFNRIVLTTTMWDDVDEETGAEREKELADVYWKSMISRGSSVKRFLNNRSSAFEILTPIINEVNKNSALLLQKEMMDLQLQLRQTSAGKTLFLELEELVARHQRALSRIRGGLTEPSFDQEQLKEVMEEYQRVSAQLQRAVEDMQRMKVSTGEWFKKLVIKKNWKRILGFFKGNSRKASTDPMISPNPTPDLPPDLAGAGVVNSSDASMEDTENPGRIKTPKSPPKDSSTVQNARVTGVIDASMEDTENPDRIKTPESPPKDSSTVQNARVTGLIDASMEDTENPDRIKTPESPPKDSSTVQNARVTGVVNSSNASMEDTENPDRIKTPELPRKDSSTVQNARVTEETDSSNHANAVVTSSDSMIDRNQRPEDSSPPAHITSVPKVLDRNPTLHSLPEQKDTSTPAPIPSAAGVTDAGNSVITAISAPAQIPSAPKVDSGKHVNVTMEAIPNPGIGANPTPGLPDPLKSDLGQEKLDSDSQNFKPFVTDSTSKLPSESTSRKIPYLSYGEDTSGNNSSDKVNSDNSGAASHGDSHNTGGNVDTGTAETLPAQPSVTNVAGNNSSDNDNTDTGSGSTIADFSVIKDHISETTHHLSSSNAGHSIATTNLPSSDSNVLSADIAFGPKVKGAISDNFTILPVKTKKRTLLQLASFGPKKKKTITAKVGHTANK